MTEILTTGLLGLYNRINLFSTTIQKEVVDVTVFMDKIPEDNLAANRVMMTVRTESIMLSGKDVSPEGFLRILYDDVGKIHTKKEYESVRENYQPEFNTGTDYIGEDNRKIGNIVMLIARADFHIRHGHDLFLHEYIQMLSNNGAIREDL